MDQRSRMSGLVLLIALMSLCGHAVAGRAIYQVETPASPHLALLQEQLKAGKGGALEVFWKEISQQGAPLIEAIKGDTRHVLVTFVWRARGETRNVLLFSYALTHPDEVGIRQGQLSRLADTDLWCKSYVLRRDARVSYVFSPNDSLRPEDMQRRLANAQSDPLNPNHGFGLESPQASILALPETPTPIWTTKRSDAPTGKVEVHKFRSALLNSERVLRVYTPPGYKPTDSGYGLLILFDGQFHTNQVPAPTILDNLIVDKAVPPLVAVLIDNPDGLTRLRELHCNEVFTEFLAKELTLWIRRNYRVTTDPRQVVIGGTSAGGLAAAFAALQHPELFGAVLSNSGSFGWKPGMLDRIVNPGSPSQFDDGRYADFGWLIGQYAERPRQALLFYLDVGLMEDVAPRRPVQAGVTSQAGELSGLVANRYLRDVLRAKGYEVRYYEFNGGHSDGQFQTLANGLLALLGSGSVKANLR